VAEAELCSSWGITQTDPAHETGLRGRDPAHRSFESCGDGGGEYCPGAGAPKVSDPIVTHVTASRKEAP
jgi:hypothetical protein